MQEPFLNYSLKSLDFSDLDLHAILHDSHSEHYQQQPYWEPQVENLSQCNGIHAQEHDCSSCQALLNNSHQTLLNQTDEIEQHFCNCQKTGCVKLYCSCFRVGRECNQNCVCCECHNHSGDQKLEVAIERVSHSTKTGFDHFEGCKCKKSKCKLNYCECLIRGFKCADICKCKKCENGKIYVKTIRKRKNATPGAI